MTNYQCGSCSYECDDFDGLQQHLQQAGHVSGHKRDLGEPLEAGEAAAAAEPHQEKAGNGRLVLEVGLATGLVVATATAAVLSGKYKEAVKLSSGLFTELAQAVAENAYLKSASGAAATLRSFGR